MKRNWTQKQRDAIEARDGSLLVSAAAGSGKTAVLVERVIERITDENKPCKADRLLIVTFTKAAANEMRERIAASLEEKIKENPDNGFLTEQQMLLPGAMICTIDSFCNTLVRENFHILDISAEYRIADESENMLMCQEAVDKTLEEFYAEGSEDFLELVETLFSGRDDSSLAEAITELYKYSRAYHFPEEWLDGIESCYNPDVPVKSSPFGRIILDYVKNAAEYCLSLTERMKLIISANEYMVPVYDSYVYQLETAINSFLDETEKGDWDSASSKAAGCVIRKPNAKKGTADSDEEVLFKSCHEAIMSTFKEKIVPAMCVSEEENRDDSKELLPVVRMLVRCVKAYSKNLDAIKKEKNCYDFSDISHMALSLLVKNVNGKAVRTPLAEEMSERFEEILIDEYQDTNIQQDMLFSSVSRNGENLFRVGDVKQCIYAFRQAMPDIFISIRERLEEYHGVYPAKITLDRNFRSRKGVTGFINFVFSQLMSRESANIEYDDGEELVAEAQYPETTEPQAEFHIIDLGSEDIKAGTDEAQAEYTASLIRKMMSGERQITENGKQRNIRYSDICVLMRAVSTSGITFANAMRRWNIPCYTEVTEDFFSAPEVAVMLSLLRVIDNPVQDIPLMSVMMSPVFSFSPDEMAQIRISDRKTSIYSRLVAKENENEKISEFLKFFRRMRFIAATSTASSLIRKIYEETAYPAIVQAMKDGQIRKANLMLLLDYADLYEKNGNTGLSGFIRYIDKLCDNKQTLDASKAVSENADVVRIMTVHKSKGLEFPICILARADKNFNERDENGSIVFNRKYGFGIKRRNTELMSEYETLSRKASKIMLNVSSRQEEMRVLYVAMTRAKEDLIVITSVKNTEKTVSALSSDIDITKKKLQPFSVLGRKCYSDWLIKTLIRHEDAYALREAAHISSDCVIKSDFNIRFEVVTKIPEYTFAHTTVTDENETDKELQKLIDERIKYRYKYASLIGIPVKRAASAIGKEYIDRENFAEAKPAFIDGEKLSAGEKGTAMHTFVQCADLMGAREDTESEIERLVLQKKLTDAQAKAISVGKAREFFTGGLCERMIKSEKLLREKKFTVDIPIEKMYPEIENSFGEKLMIMGIIDCAFLENGEWVLVDYKTDRVKSAEELSEKYRSQLSAYKYALEMITPHKVKEVYLYSFCLSAPVRVEMSDGL